jgi:glycosyltransferase involved in cell wall biosynthesis
VSGISTVVGQIIKNSRFEFVHFAVGRRDGEKLGLRWATKQISLLKDFRCAVGSEKIGLAHLNTSFNPLSILRDFALAKLAARAKKPILLHVHGGKFLAREFENKQLAQIAEQTARLAQVLIVLSDLEREIIEKRWQNLNVAVLPNAVEMPVASFAPRNNPKPFVLFLGRLHESKGLREIVAACRKLKLAGFDFAFRAFGAGESENRFVAEMTDVLGRDFYFGGVAAGNLKEKEFSQADIFVLPSRYGEGLPLALLEAMAHGCICIATEMASLASVIENNSNGFLIEPQNAAQLAQTLQFLFENRAAWENLRENARRTIAAKFRLNDYIRNLEQIYYREIAGS